MIISHRKKFVYFRVPKTASSTAELMLRLSRAFNKEEDIMSGVLSGLPHANIPQRIFDRMQERVAVVFGKYYKTPGKFDAAHFQERIDRSVGTFMAHMPPKDAIKHGLITLDQLREYKVLAFIRDPYERHLSAFRHTMGNMFVTPDMYKDALKTDPKMTDTEMVLIRPQADYFYVKNENGEMEQIAEPLFFDDLDNEVRRLISIAGGFEFDEIPIINPAKRPLVTDKANYFDEEVHSILDKHLAVDVELYNRLKKEYGRD